MAGLPGSRPPLIKPGPFSRPDGLPILGHFVLSAGELRLKSSHIVEVDVVVAVEIEAVAFRNMGFATWAGETTELTARTFGTILREGSPSSPSLGPILSCLSQGLSTTRYELPSSRYLHTRCLKHGDQDSNRAEV
jgi:hypothetical protein